jgi:hypothetical protein
MPSARSLSLLFPPRESHDRANKESNQPVEPLYDQDSTVTFPLSPDHEPRIIIAQDDTGVSIDRLLFDSHWSRNTLSRDTPIPLSRPLSSAGPSSSGFLRPQSSRGHGRSAMTGVSVHSNSPPTRPSMPRLDSTFVPSTQLRRTSTPTSLADARKELDLPFEDTAEEMDSWLDCMFGKTPMRYKGPVTKLHPVQRQPVDPSQRAVPPSSPHTLGSGQKKLHLRKDALLMCTTFAVHIHEEDLPEQLQQATSVHGVSTSCARKTRFNTPMFGVAILLPLAKPRENMSPGASASHTTPKESDPFQAVLDDWHIYARALDALRMTCLIQIQQTIRAKAEALARSKVATSPKVPRLIKLEPGAFEHTPQVVDMSAAVMDRITRSCQVLQAMPQRDWSIWRDELRDYTRVSQESDSKRGFFNLHKINFMQVSLTAALSVNLGWLSIFAPPYHQARLREEHLQRQSTFDSAQNRMVVVSLDQNKARNLVFIFAKLFPGSESEPQFERPRRSSSNSLSSSTKHVSAITLGLKAASCSPEESKAYSNGSSHGNGHISSNPPLTPTIFEPMFATPDTSPLKHPSSSNSSSRSSRKSSFVNTSGKIDIPRKASVALPISATASTRTTPVGSLDTRTSSSLNAQVDLMRHLQRTNSAATTNSSTDTNSLWNSFRSSTWSLKPRRESSLSERSDSLASTGPRDQPTGILKTSKSFAARQSGSKLVRMVEEVHGGVGGNGNDNDRYSSRRTPARISTNGVPHRISALQFDPPGADYPGIAYTYNQDEGVVDVDFPGCTPFVNTSRNPSSKVPKLKVPNSKRHFPLQDLVDHATTHTQALEGLEGFARYDRMAGYLDKFHPDFVLQATRPYAELLSDIKCAMRAEPSPMIEPSENLKVFSQETWIDVCSTVVVDAEALTVKRLTLHRRVRYKLILPDESPSLPRHLTAADRRKKSIGSSNGSGSDHDSQIKIIKSDDMDSIKRTYKRNDNGKKTGFRDQKIVKTDMTGGETNGLTNNQPSSLGSSVQSSRSNNSPVDSPMAVKDESVILEQRPVAQIVGDDLSEFIDDRKTKTCPSKEAPTTPVATKRVPIHNKDGKISGWKEVDTGCPDEAGVNDLPTGFVEKRCDKAAAVVECQTLSERFDEETISKPDSAVVTLMQQMLATSETKSRAHSRTNSLHSRAPSRTNSICGSGLSELQYESKKIIEDALEGLVSLVASDKYTSSSGNNGTFSSSGGLFNFARGTASSTPEPSILRQSISRWMYGDG